MPLKLTFTLLFIFWHFFCWIFSFELCWLFEFFLFFIFFISPIFLFFCRSPFRPPFPSSRTPLPLRPLSASPEPSAPPQEIKCSSTSSTSLLVSWRPPPLRSQNGDLTGYRVLYQVVSPSEGAGGDPKPTEEPMVPPTVEQVLLQRLGKWTQYHITVSAATEVGSGPESEPIICRTDEDGTSEDVC